MSDNIYKKLQDVRVKLQRLNIKKTGKNSFSGYDYYELGDILPPINDFMAEYGLCSHVTFDSDFARLTIINAENPEETLTFTSPMAGVSLKGAHDIQNLGAVETYQRRYLYLAAFEIVEHDFFDATQGKDNKAGNGSRAGSNNVGNKSYGKPVPPANKPAGANKPEPKPNTQLSAESGKAINTALARYAKLTGTAVASAVKQLEKTIGKPMSAVVEDDVYALLGVIDAWIVEYNEMDKGELA